MLSGVLVALNKSSFSIVCDAGPLIHLDELNCLDLLSDFKKIFIPDTVLQEVKLHRPQILRNNLLTFEHVNIKYFPNIGL